MVQGIRIRRNRAGCYFFNYKRAMWGPYLSEAEDRAKISQLNDDVAEKAARAKTRAKSLHIRRTKRRRIIDENKDILIDQWRSEIWEGPICFRKIPGPDGIIVLEQKELCDPSCEPVIAWFGPKINHTLDNFRPMLLHDNAYYLYAYAGDVTSLAYAHQLRIHTKYTLDITKELSE